jgi:hypothetical protein
MGGEVGRSQSAEGIVNLFADNLSREHYIEAIKDLQRGLAQLDSVSRGEAQDDCAICGDTDHTAGQCWFHNPLLLASVGSEAIIGNCWRCFHCSAVFLDEQSAKRHFGEESDDIARCIQQLADVIPVLSQPELSL